MKQLVNSNLKFEFAEGDKVESWKKYDSPIEYQGDSFDMRSKDG